MANFARAKFAVVSIVNGAKRRRIERRHLVDNEPVQKTASWEFHGDVPDAIDAFAHVMA